MTQQQELTNQVKDILKRIGLNFEIKKDYDEYISIGTIAGELKIRPNKERCGKVWTIFTCFEDVDSIPKCLIEKCRVNTFSGKMNFHTLKMAQVLYEFDMAMKLLKESEQISR